MRTHLILCVSILLAGCATQSARHSGPFVTAKVTRLVDEQRRTNKSVVQTSKPEEVQKLASFFPGLGTRKRSNPPASWVTLVFVKLSRADGSSVTIRSNYEHWNDGTADGQWFVDGDLEAYVNKLFEDRGN